MNKLDRVTYKGLEHEVKLISYPGKATKIILRENEFYVYINNKNDDIKLMQAAADGLRQWMVEAAKEQIKSRTKELSRLVGVSYNSIRIKDAKTRWGSCSSKNNLNFNFRIIMAPQEVMDYIIFHELCHLKHMNHGEEFWEAVAQYMPEYKSCKKWLKVNGVKLYVI